MRRRIHLSPRDRVRRLINMGYKSPARLAQKARLDIEVVATILDELRHDGLIHNQTGKSVSKCLLAEVWR